MFCGKCGAKNPDNASFCTACGAPLESDFSKNVGEGAVQPKVASNKNYKKIGIITVLIAVAALAFILVPLFIGRSYKSTINEGYEAVVSVNGKKMLSLFPDKVVESVCEDEDITKKEMAEEWEEEIEDLLSGAKTWYGVTPREISCKIVGVKDIYGDSLEEMQDDFEDHYDVKVKAARKVTVEITLGDNSMEESIPVIKVGPSWYLGIDLT